MAGNLWDRRYGGADYLFGEEPNAFLQRQNHRLRPGWTALALADGEARNGVWLAQQGLSVLSVDSSAVAQEKGRRLAAARGVSLDFQLEDLEHWKWPERQFDLVVAIFIQFAGPSLRTRLFEGMQTALKPGGLLLLEGYRPEQIAYGTGGPSAVENLYTEDILRTGFPRLEILELREHDTTITEGAGHRGMSALIDLVARLPVAP